MRQPKESFKCPECGAHIVPVLNENGEYVCPQCGVVLESSIIDPGVPWRAYTREQELRRATAEKMKRGSDTTPYSVRQQFKIGISRVRASEASLDRYLRELENVCRILRIPSYIKDDAVSFFKKAKTKGLLRGRNYKRFIAAAIYSAVKLHSSYFVDINELGELLSMNPKDILKTHKLLIEKGIIEGSKKEPSKPSNYVTFIIDKLGLTKELSSVLIHILNFADSIGHCVYFQGKRPKSIAAATVYIFSVLLSYKRSQSDVASIVNISSPTLRRIAADIPKKLDIIIEI
ncbi:MAG: hypothetical protein DRJ35_04855 [Thermoprotei archaeon]|nr:MAG: hypothetical protein DRJ35_04855 [Thermoprotei archaeon]